jgi:hypothetical protein
MGTSPCIVDTLDGAASVDIPSALDQNDISGYPVTRR